MRGVLRGAPRVVRVAAAQMGPIQRSDDRESAVRRLTALLHQAADQGAQLVVFPELALTTFFPRWFVDDISSTDHYYERTMPSPATQPLFDAAKQRSIGFSLGFAELTSDGHRFNSQVLVERDGRVVATYRKVHIP
ncbi:MAG: N-carbamoyl-D-amino-acid hydrolase, partial [Actinobacteria bacterium]|nr:N-carbamoyl-D-amino-acid hydrolase [Actinomycetota bacterium]